MVDTMKDVRQRNKDCLIAVIIIISIFAIGLFLLIHFMERSHIIHDTQVEMTPVAHSVNILEGYKEECIQYETVFSYDWLPEHMNVSCYYNFCSTERNKNWSDLKDNYFIDDCNGLISNHDVSIQYKGEWPLLNSDNVCNREALIVSANANCLVPGHIIYNNRTECKALSLVKRVD